MLKNTASVPSPPHAKVKLNGESLASIKLAHEDPWAASCVECSRGGGSSVGSAADDATARAAATNTSNVAASVGATGITAGGQDHQPRWHPRTTFCANLEGVVIFGVRQAPPVHPRASRPHLERLWAWKHPPSGGAGQPPGPQGQLRPVGHAAATPGSGSTRRSWRPPPQGHTAHDAAGMVVEAAPAAWSVPCRSIADHASAPVVPSVLLPWRSVLLVPFVSSFEGSPVPGGEASAWAHHKPRGPPPGRQRPWSRRPGCPVQPHTR